MISVSKLCDRVILKFRDYEVRIKSTAILLYVAGIEHIRPRAPSHSGELTRLEAQELAKILKMLADSIEEELANPTRELQLRQGGQA